MPSKRDDNSRGRPSTANSGTAVENPLATALGLLARSLDEHGDANVTLAAIVAAAVTTIPGADGASVSIVDGRRIVSQAPTNHLASVIDLIQDEVQQGPCLESALQNSTVRSRDLAAEERWPLFSTRASAAGVASMLSIQLFVVGHNLGSLNLHSRTPGAFTDESENVGLLFAVHAAIAYAAARKEEHFAAGLASRDVIGQAKGMLAERYGISADRAFALLVRLSRDNNRRLADVAADLNRTGRLPEAVAEQFNELDRTTDSPRATVPGSNPGDGS